MTAPRCRRPEGHDRADGRRAGGAATSTATTTGLRTRQRVPAVLDRPAQRRQEIWTAPLSEGGTCTPPPAPTNLAATAVGTGRIDLTWIAAPGATEYHVYRSTTSGSGHPGRTGRHDVLRHRPEPYFYVVRSFAGCESATRTRRSRRPSAVCTVNTLIERIRERRIVRLDARHLRLRRRGGSVARHQACTARPAPGSSATAARPARRTARPTTSTTRNRKAQPASRCPRSTQHD